MKLRKSLLPLVALAVMGSGQGQIQASETRASQVPVIGAAIAADIVPSTTAGALAEPGEWSCEPIWTEYRLWLAGGNAAGSWKFDGKTYQARGTGELYRWADWLDWANKQGCDAAGKLPKAQLGNGSGLGQISGPAGAAGGGGGNTLLYVGGGIGGAALLALGLGGGGGGADTGGGGTRPDSPG